MGSLWNVRLAHKKCNNEDYAWRGDHPDETEGKSLQEMADRLNRKGVRGPKGSGSLDGCEREIDVRRLVAGISQDGSSERAQTCSG